MYACVKMKPLKGKTMKTAYMGKLSLALLASASVAITAAPTYAQSSDGAFLDEIVVTAQKREENLQEVPLAITAISADKIDQLKNRNKSKGN
mgnify:CR=1 FL=1